MRRIATTLNDMSERSKAYLKSRGLKNPPLDSGISGGGDAPRTYVSDVMDEWNPYLTKRIEELEKKLENIINHTTHP